jgi:hypothetical protein
MFILYLIFLDFEISRFMYNLNYKDKNKIKDIFIIVFLFLVDF